MLFIVPLAKTMKFSTHLHQILSYTNKSKPSLSVIAGDFNARSSSCCSNDINTAEGSKLYSATSASGSDQLINEPTYIETKSSSCIDLIITDQPNLSINYGVHASLHPNCHHQVVHTSFNLNISYHSSFQRLIWDYKKADSTTIRKALDLVKGY